MQNFPPNFCISRGTCEVSLRIVSESTCAAHADAVDGSWSGNHPTRDDVVRAEQARLGVAV